MTPNDKTTIITTFIQFFLIAAQITQRGYVIEKETHVCYWQNIKRERKKNQIK